MARQADRTTETAGGTGSLTEQTAAARVKKPLVDFPFRLTVEHAALDFKGMFASAEAFDFYEVNGVAGENSGKARLDLCVDIVEVTPTSTTVHVTPARPMSYADIAAE